MLSHALLSGRWVAVWRRNARVWQKMAKPSLVGNFGEPLLYILALGYGLGGFIGDVDGITYVVFLASGIICSSAMNTASFEGLYAAYTRMEVQGTWSAMLATPLVLEDIVLGEVAWMGTKSLISAAAILVVAALLGLVSGWEAIWVLPVALLIGCCFGAMALVVTALASSYDFFLYYFTLVVTPMFLMSGIFFPLAELPEVVRAGAELLPLSHAVVVVRPLMTEMESTLWMSLHLLVPLLYGVVAVWLATRLLRKRLMV